MDPEITQIDDNEAVIDGLRARMAPAARVVVDIIDGPMPRVTQVTAARGKIVEVQRATGSYFGLGDIIRVDRTGENMLVVGKRKDVLHVKRSLGFVAKQKIRRGDVIVLIRRA